MALQKTISAKTKGKVTVLPLDKIKNASTSKDPELSALLGNLDIISNVIAVSGDETRYYICCKSLFKVISVDEARYKAAAQPDRHYVSYKKNIYLSSNGVLLAMCLSNQPAAIALIRYMFEILVLLERDGYVAVEDVKSRDAVTKELSKHIDVPSAVDDATLAKIQELVNEQGSSIIEMPSTISRLERECRVVSKGLSMMAQTSADIKERDERIGTTIEETKTFLDKISSLVTALSRAPSSTFSSADKIKERVCKYLDVDVVAKLRDTWSKIGNEEQKAAKEFATSLMKLEDEIEECASKIKDEEETALFDDFLLEMEKKDTKAPAVLPPNTKEYSLVRAKYGVKTPSGIRYDWRVMTDEELCGEKISSKAFPIISKYGTYDNFKEISDDYMRGKLSSEEYPFEFVLYQYVYFEPHQLNIFSGVLSRFNLTEADVIYFKDLVRTV